MPGAGKLIRGWEFSVDSARKVWTIWGFFRVVVVVVVVVIVF